MKEFAELIKFFDNNAYVEMMHKFVQHGKTSTYVHCRNVAKASYKINKRLHLGADAKSLVRAGMLHDFYLYDWHDNDHRGTLHGFKHPRIACENAKKHFDISRREQEAILSHMWPLNIKNVPKTKEAAIICLADKYCALVETFHLVRDKNVDK